MVNGDYSQQRVENAIRMQAEQSLLFHSSLHDSLHCNRRMECAAVLHGNFKISPNSFVKEGTEQTPSDGNSRCPSRSA